jgi:hypothetical protein
MPKGKSYKGKPPLKKDKKDKKKKKGKKKGK